MFRVNQMFKARLKRLEGNVARLLSGGADRGHLLSCLDEASSLSLSLEQEREELGQEILKLRNARSVAGSYFKSIKNINKKGN